MIWTSRVQISDQMCRRSQRIMQYARLIGVFPLVVETEQGKLFLKWSLWHAIYSYAIAMLVVIAIYYAMYLDFIQSDDASVTTLYEIDKIATLLASTGYSLMVICGVFVTPSKFRIFFNYVDCLNQIDSIVATTYSHKHTWMLNALMAYNLIGVLVDCYFYYTTVNDASAMVVCFIIEVAVLYVNGLTLIVEYANFHLVSGLEQRILALNQLIENYCKNLEKLSQSVKYKSNCWVSNNAICIQTVARPCGSFISLREAYLKLINAVDLLNELLAPNTLMALLCIFSLLTVYLYYFILTIEGRRKGTIELIDLMICSSMFVIGTLLLTEPRHSYLLRIQKTKSFVCRLLSLHIDYNDRKQIDTFALVICLREPSFSVYGLLNVDRFLYASLIGTITTYVVIFLQYQEKENNFNSNS